MARTFGGVSTDRITLTLASVLTRPLSIGGWQYLTGTGGNGNGRVFANSGGGTPHLLAPTSTTDLKFEWAGTTGMVANATGCVSANGWYCVICTIDTDLVGHIFTAPLNSGTMTEATYSVHTTGVGLFGPTVEHLLGNRNNAGVFDRNWAGRLAQQFAVPWIMSLAEMEMFHRGMWPVLYLHGQPNYFLPLDSPTLAAAADLSGNGANGVVTGCAVFDGPGVGNFMLSSTSFVNDIPAGGGGVLAAQAQLLLAQQGRA